MRAQVQRASNMVPEWQWQLLNAVLTAAGSPPGQMLPVGTDLAWIRDSLRMLAACSTSWPAEIEEHPAAIDLAEACDDEEDPTVEEDSFRARAEEEARQEAHDRDLWESHQAAVYRDWEDWLVLHSPAERPDAMRITVSASSHQRPSPTTAPAVVQIPAGQLPLTLNVRIERVTTPIALPSGASPQGGTFEQPVSEVTYVPELDVAYQKWKAGEISDQAITEQHGANWLDLFLGQRDLEMADTSTQLDPDLMDDHGAGGGRGPDKGLAAEGEVVTLPDDQPGSGLSVPAVAPLLHDQDVPEGMAGYLDLSMEGQSGYRDGDSDEPEDRRGSKRRLESGH